MDTNANRDDPDDHNYGPPRSPDEPRPPFPPDEEQSNPELDEQPLRLTTELKRKREESQPIRQDSQSRQGGAKVPKIYTVGIEDWRTASIACNQNIPGDEPRPSPFFTNPQTRYPAPCATYPNPERIYEQDEPIASTSDGPTYIRPGSSRFRATETVVSDGVFKLPPAVQQGTRTSMFKTRWLRHHLEETLPQTTVFEPMPSTSRQSNSPGPQPDTVNVSTQVEFGELGNITYENQMEEQIESLKCLLCQATNYCRKKCSMRGRRPHEMWCIHGIHELDSDSRLPEPDTTDTLNLTVDQNQNYHSDIFANDVYIETSQNFSIPGTSSQVTQLPETHHDQVVNDDPTE